MPGTPFKSPARPKIRASVKRPASPAAARRASSNRQMPGVASGRGLMGAPAIKPARVISTPKSSGAKRAPAARQGTNLSSGRGR